MRSIILTALAVLTAWAPASGARDAGAILRAAQAQGGLVVVIGCDDPALLAGLRPTDAYLVHGLDTDLATVKRARWRIRSLGCYGPVSVDTFDGRRLPYVDNLVNLLVADHAGDVPADEIMRVLAPRGVACVGGATTVKPWPSAIDEWTHWLHGPDGNAVAEDEVVGPPRCLQWIEKPLWLKHHNATISFSAMVSAKGRLFYIIDESPPGLFGLPRKWALLARDAFNGALLWRRPLEHWGWKAWVGTGRSGSRFDQPTDLQRKLIAVGDHVYLPLGAEERLSRLDAAGGKVLNTYKGTERVSEVLYHDGRLIVSVHRPAEGAGAKHLDKSLLVLEADSGRLLWEKNKIKGLAGKTNELAKYTSLYLVAAAGRLFYADHDSVVCLDIDTGREVWRVPRPPRGKTQSRYARLYVPDLCTLVAREDVLLFAQTVACNKTPWNEPVRTTLLGLSTKTGETLWETPCGNWGYHSPTDVFVANNVAWVHGADDYTLMGLDPSTGAVKHRFSTKKAMDGPHHHRCYRNKATSHYVLTGRRGVEFLELESGEQRLHHWVRGACRYGILPCNGLLYVPPDPCMCYATAKVNGFLALAAGRRAYPETPPAERLEKGPAFGKTAAASLSAPWPTYRHDPRRSGATAAALPSSLARTWCTEVGGGLSSVTVAGGKVFVASARKHTLYALDAASGEEVWQYTAGGPVDSPPTFHEGNVLFGSADGRVYCLRALDGTLAWRFQAAPADVRVSAFGQLASAWPVHGSVLVENGTAYVTAGRSSFLDGGIRVYALDPATGNVLQQRTIYTPDPRTGEARYDARLRYDMPPDQPGALSDILVSDGQYLHMRHTKIDPKNLQKDFERSMTEAQKKAFYQEKQTGKVLDFGPQVASTAGLLDGSWFNATFWSFANASHSRLLVFDKQCTYGVKAYGGGASRHTRSKFVAGSSKYTLFADDRQSKKRRWSVAVPIRVRAVVAAGDKVFVAGTPDRVPPNDPWAAYEGRCGGLLWTVSKKDGKKLAESSLVSPPVWDGMAVGAGRLYMTATDGKVRCFAGK